MENNSRFRLCMIIVLTTLVAVSVHPAESECVPRSESLLARSLLPLFPTSSDSSSAPSPSPSESPAPAPAPSEKESEAPSAAPIGAKPDASSQPSASFDLSGICAKTDFPDVCASTLSSVSSSNKADPSLVLESMIQALTQEIKAAVAKIGSWGGMGASADCQQTYDDALSSIQEALAALKVHDIPTVQIMLSAALTDFSTCGDGFAESGASNPMNGADDKLMQMASNCLALASLVK